MANWRDGRRPVPNFLAFFVGINDITRWEKNGDDREVVPPPWRKEKARPPIDLAFPENHPQMELYFE
jgi:hypothetical protein